MFARTSTRRSRLLAAAALVAATGAAALAPATAFADAPAATGAPAPSGAKPLVATLEPAAGQAPLTRGGTGASLTLTVTNNSDQEQPFHPTVTVKPVGPTPSGWTWIDFSAKAISAPATWGTAGWGDNNDFTGSVLPDHGMAFVPFKVPAHATYTWAVSFKLKAALPAGDTAVTVALRNDLGDSTDSAPVTLPVASPTGALVQNFTNNSGTVSYKQPFETELVLTNNGAAVDAAINPTLRLGDGSRPVPAALRLEVSQDGTWVTVPGSDDVWKLPPVAGGLRSGDAHRYKVRLSMTGSTGKETSSSASLSLVPDTDRGPVDTTVSASVTVDTFGAPTVPSASPSTSTSTSTAKPSPTGATGAPSTPSGTPGPTTPATTPAGTPGAQVVPAANTGPSAPAATAAPAAGHLAATGAGDSGALLGAGGAMVLLGAGAVFYAKRRRTRTQG